MNLNIITQIFYCIKTFTNSGQFIFIPWYIVETRKDTTNWVQGIKDRYEKYFVNKIGSSFQFKNWRVESENFILIINFFI